MVALLSLLSALLLSAAAGGAEYYQSDAVCYLKWSKAGGCKYMPQTMFSYYDVTGSWQALQRAYKVPDTHPDQVDWRCEDLSRVVITEAFDPAMLVRRRPVRPFPGGVPKALYKWPGPITHAEFKATPTWQDSSHEIAKYKLMGGRLYVRGERHPKMRAAEEMLLVAAYLYDLPDVDFAISWCDSVYDGMPVIQYAGDVRKAKWGFTYPYAPTIWPSAINLQQSLAWARCVRDQNPPARRIPRAVWRGTTTDVGGFVSYERFLSMSRVQLHTLGLIHSDVLDTKLVKAIQTQEGVDAAVLDRILNVTEDSRLSMDAFERYAAVVDVDGNGFSSRLHWLAQRGLLVLKQASPLPSYFEHLLAPGVSLQQFAGNLTDVAEVAARAVAGATGAAGPQAAAAAARMSGNMAAIAAVALNKWAMVEALAFSLAKYGSKIDWLVRMEPGHERIPFTDCCQWGNLPQEFVDAMHTAEPPEQAFPPAEQPQQPPQQPSAAAAAQPEEGGAARRRRLLSMGDGSEACVGFAPPPPTEAAVAAAAAPEAGEGVEGGARAARLEGDGPASAGVSPATPAAALLLGGGAPQLTEGGGTGDADGAAAAVGDAGAEVLTPWRPPARQTDAAGYARSYIPTLMLCVSVILIVATLGLVHGLNDRGLWALLRKRPAELLLVPNGRGGVYVGDPHSA